MQVKVFTSQTANSKPQFHSYQSVDDVSAFMKKYLEQNPNGKVEVIAANDQNTIFQFAKPQPNKPLLAVA